MRTLDTQMDVLPDESNKAGGFLGTWWWRRWRRRIATCAEQLGFRIKVSL